MIRELTTTQLDSWWHELFHSATQGGKFMPVNAAVQKVMDEIGEILGDDYKIDGDAQ